MSQLQSPSAWRTREFELEGLGSPVAGACPASAFDQPQWYFASREGRLVGIDADLPGRFFEHQLPFAFDVERGGAELAASHDGRFVAVVQGRGLQGALVDTRLGTIVKPLVRSDYHANVSGWALAIVRRADRDVLIHATAWNELAAFALPSLEKLSGGGETSRDYFFGILSPSPSGRSIITSGWVWHPLGVMQRFDLDAWLESGTEPALSSLTQAEWWDDGACWLDEERVAVIGTERDDDDAFPFFSRQEGTVILNVATQTRELYLPGVVGGMACDGSTLFVYGAGETTTRAFSLKDRTWLEPLPLQIHHWHPSAKVALACEAFNAGTSGLCTLAWRPNAVDSAVSAVLRAKAAGLRQQVTPEALLVLADALEESAGARELISHCRAGEPHGRDCWVVEALSAATSKGV